jgi:ABC-type metal ion transport system substrate-binding protein
MEAYTLKKKKDTEEYHLFEGKMTEEGCTSKQVSVCEKMDKSETAGNIFACEAENSARKKCAKIGKAVCSVCVSHFYTKY